MRESCLTISRFSVLRFLAILRTGTKWERRRILEKHIDRSTWLQNYFERATGCCHRHWTRSCWDQHHINHSHSSADNSTLSILLPVMMNQQRAANNRNQQASRLALRVSNICSVTTLAKQAWLLVVVSHVLLMFPSNAPPLHLLCSLWIGCLQPSRWW